MPDETNILAGLPSDVRDSLKPRLQLRNLTTGDVLYSTGELVDVTCKSQSYVQKKEPFSSR